MNIIGDKLSEWRHRAGLTQDDAAVIFGVNQPAYCKWERGKAKMSLVALARLEGLIGRQEKAERLIRKGEK